MTNPSLTAQRLASWARGEPCAPVRIELHVTNRCNLKCLFCWQAIAERNAALSEISHEKAIEIVEDAGRIGVKEWIISGGGEPLMRRQTVTEVFRRIKKHGMWGQLTTNGVLFTPELIQEMVSIGWDQVQFSIDGPDAATHDFLRSGPGAFEKATRHLRLFAQAKEQQHSTLPYVGINCILTNRVHDRLSDMIRLAADCGSQLVFFEPVYSGYLSDIKLNITPEDHTQFLESIEAALNLATRLGVATNLANYRNPALVAKDHFEEVVLQEVAAFSPQFIHAPCFQPWYLMGIKGDGLAGCCSTFTRGEYIHTKTLEEIWFGDVFNAIRADMIARRLPDYCNKCSIVVVLDNKKFRQELWELLSTKGEIMTNEQPQPPVSTTENDLATQRQTLEKQVQSLDDQLNRLKNTLQERNQMLTHYTHEHRTIDRLRKTIAYRLYRLIKGF